MPAKKFVIRISYFALIDSVILALIYFILNFILGETWFLERYNLIWFSIISTTWAILIEIKGVYWFKEWEYNGLMPKIFGIGLSPLVQLTLTGLTSLLLLSL